MKRQKLTKKQAQTIAGKNYFVGTLTACWAKANENRFQGSSPISTLAGEGEVIFLSESGDVLYKLLNVVARYEKETVVETEDCVYELMREKNTGLTNIVRV